MSTDTNTERTEEQEEHQAVVDKILHGKPIPPPITQRIRAKAQRITDELRRQHGLLDIGVPANRELRGELPDA
jgi:hypothetical protein